METRETSWEYPLITTTLLALTSAMLLCLLGSSTKAIVLESAAAALAGLLLFFPIKTSIFFFFAYLLLDGAIKINTNYNPIIHVGQDLLLILLMARSCQDRAGFSKFFLTPHFPACLVLFAWILLQYLNPFGLGILPSIAGTKVYVSMLCLYFLIYHHLPREEIPSLLRWILLLCTVEALLATIEYYVGQSWMMNLHPRYREMIMTNFAGIFYRPFGTTAVPGGPSVWVMLGAPIAGYFLQRRGSFVKDKIPALLFIALALPALIFCQVRVSMLASAIGLISAFLFPSPRLFSRILAAALLVPLSVVIVMSYLNSNTTQEYAWVNKLSDQQRNAIFERALSLGNVKTYMNARQGALEQSLVLADQTVLGIGLSRVGAASEIWRARIEKDPYFGPKWSFADNVFKAIFTDLGIFGLLAWIALVATVIGSLYIRSLKKGMSRDFGLIWMAATAGSMLVLIGFANEGVLYNPVSGLFWAFLALGTKEAYA